MTLFENLRPLFPYMRRYRRGFLLGGFFAVCSNAIWVLFPEVIRRAIDDMTKHLSYRGILFYAGILVAVALSKGVFLFLTRWVLIGISRDIEYDLRNDLFRVLERQAPSYFQENRTGDIMARATNDLNAVRMLLGPAIMYSANTLLFTVGALVFMLRISPWLTLLAFVPLPAASILVQYFGRKIHERFERIQAMYSDISARVQENVSGARLVRAFAQEEAEISAFERANAEYVRRALRLVRLMGMLWPTLEFMLGLSLVVVLLVGGHEVVDAKISVGAFVAFTTYMMMLTWPVIALGWVVNLVQRGTASVTRIHEILIAEPSISDATLPATGAVATEIRGEIEFRNLSFTYDNSTAPVLRNIDLRIPAGSSFAIVGPTGSGKTTTLYAALNEIKSDEDKIITIEDPVEYQIRGITQIPVNEKKGLTFARGLRSILRHDPDKILVGEIRDQETAQIAINSALTGHLVFTTVHANNVVDVLGRFLNMGVEPYNFVSALNCILAQRLVRVICEDCKRPVQYDRETLQLSGLDTSEWSGFDFQEGAGCIECGGTGYRGRTAIHELLELNDRIREIILEKRPSSEVRKAARAEGMSFLRESALQRVRLGLTTLKEINKVTFIEASR